MQFYALFFFYCCLIAHSLNGDATVDRWVIAKQIVCCFSQQATMLSEVVKGCIYYVYFF